MRERSALTLGIAALLLVAVGAQHRGLDEDIEEVWDTVGGDVMQKLVTDMENAPVAAARKMVTFLRAGDYRIVRIQLSAEARGKQLQFAKAEGMHGVLKMLKDADPEGRALAAEIVHLVTTENGPLAHMVGLQAWLPGSADVSDLLQIVAAGWAREQGDVVTDDAVFAAEEAAHAVWAMIMPSSDNLEMAHDRKGGDFMRDALVHSKSPRIRMWAAACLKRLLSDFHNTPDGMYASNARKVVDNRGLRQTFAKDAKFLKGLVRMIKKGKVTPDVHRSMWPTYVERKEGRDKPWIQAWAAAGAVGALAMSEENHELIIQAGGLKALCGLKLSPCALERVEAETALAMFDQECPALEEEEAADADSLRQDWAETEL